MSANNDNEPKNNHFMKFHERVLDKYERMQKKLEKSKSLDNLVLVSEEISVKHKDSDEFVNVNRASCSLLTVETAKVLERPISRESIIEEEDINDLLEISYSGQNEEAFIYDFTGEGRITDNFSKSSRDSLNEIGKHDDEYSLPLTPTSPSKITIRERIGSRLSRITAAREKRRKVNTEMEKYFAKDNKKDKDEKNSRNITTPTKQKQHKVATVTIALIEAKGLTESVTEKQSSSVFCRFRLGTEKCKSKSAKIVKNEAQWVELMSLNLFEDNALKLSLCDRDEIGKTVIDLSHVVKEKTHQLKIKLDEMPNIEIFVLLTITGITVVDKDYYIHNYKESNDTIKDTLDPSHKKIKSGVGCLTIIVYEATGLTSHDGYCVLELENNRVQTHTEYKNTDPKWMKAFTFIINDVTSILEVTIHDEKKDEVVGKLSIPLLSIGNGEKKWYALKDSTQRYRAKGNNPKVFMETRLSWNTMKAVVRVFNPKETVYLQTDEKFSRIIFSQHLSRARVVVDWILDAFKVVKTCFEWESRRLNVIALIIWLLFCWFFKAWMVPVILLFPFIWFKRNQFKYFEYSKRALIKLKVIDQDIDEPETDSFVKIEKEGKTSLRQKISSLQDMIQTVQNFIGEVANFGESIKNLYKFKVPYLSCLAIVVILMIAVIMYIIPIRYMLMAWSVQKFTRKILRPNRVPNNELMDFLSRIPNDVTLKNCEELPILEETNEMGDDYLQTDKRVSKFRVISDISKTNIVETVG